MTRRKLVTELLCLLFIGGISFAIAIIFLRGNPKVHYFFDWEMVPATMLACGQGFTAPDAPIPSLQAFAVREIATFDCNRLPPSLRVAPPAQIALAGRYPIYAASLAMKAWGTNWRSLDRYAAILFALSMILSYRLLRMVAAPLIALGGALLLARSTQLDALLLQRDYIKQPAFLALLLLIVWMAIRPQTRRRAWWNSGGAGVLLGIGLGCRMDLLIFFPFFLVVLFVFIQFVPNQGRWATRLVAALIFMLSLAISGLPILRTLSSGSNSAHVALLGFMTPFTASLGLARPVYDIGEQYSDGYAYTLIAAQARIRNHDHGPMPFGSRRYDQVGAQLVLDIMRHFPADMLARTYGAVFKSLAYSFSNKTIVQSKAMAAFANGSLVEKIADLRRLITDPFKDSGFWLTVAALLLLAAIDLRIATFCTFVVVYFCGYSVMQFSRRHTFHLDILSMASRVFLIQVLVSSVIGSARVRWRQWTISAVLRGVRNAGMLAAAVTLILGLPLVLARHYQQHHLRILLEAPLKEAKRIPLTTVSLNNREVLFSNPQLGEKLEPGPLEDERDVRLEYIVAELGGAACSPSATFPVRLGYTGVVHTIDKEFDRIVQVSVPPSGESVRLLTPTFYETGPYWTHFDGFIFPNERASCLSSVSRVQKPGDLPFPFLYALLGPSWTDQPLYQQFR